MKLIKNLLRTGIILCLDFIFAVIILLACFYTRIFQRREKIGLGPEPLINNVYHKKALEMYGYKVETFVANTYFITNEFDKRFDLIFEGRIRSFLSPYLIFLYTLFNFKILYIYFNGSALSLSHSNLWKLEPIFYRLSGVKTVVLPYGGDIANMLFAKELKYKNALSKDYPQFRKRKVRVERQIDIWSKHGSFILSGCDWVDFMYGWDKLCLGHFSIDTNKFEPQLYDETKTLKILHAPNHRNIKGTKHIVSIVTKLVSEGFLIDLKLLEKVPNSEVIECIKSADLIIDQLIIGWYAMFALEGLALGKPVLTYIRSDLVELYLEDGCLLNRDDLPFINSSTEEIETTLRNILNDRSILKVASLKSRPFVEKYHSLSAIGQMFADINKGLLNGK